jgi:hypothetical protein
MQASHDSEVEFRLAGGSDRLGGILRNDITYQEVLRTRKQYDEL